MSIDHNLARSESIRKCFNKHYCEVCATPKATTVAFDMSMQTVYICLGCIRQAAKLAGLT